MNKSSFKNFDFTIRKANEGDVRDLVFIEKNYAILPRWRLKDFLHIVNSKDKGVLVADLEDNIIGYAAYMKFEDQPISIKSVAVPDEYRHNFGRYGGGVGTALINFIKERSPNGCQAACRETDLASQLFLKACGLRCEMIDHGGYKDSYEDAYLFTYPPPSKTSSSSSS